ncbi:MAG: GAF domain-containing sensor histidine kinase [Patescibacteria group bacterium]
MFFSRKQQKTGTVQEAPASDSLKEITQRLYKQNTDLASRNKTLSLLSQLYEISILTLKPVDMASRICQTVQTVLSFEIVGIMLYDKTVDELAPLAFAESERLHAAHANKGHFFETAVISNVSKIKFFQKIMREESMGYTEDLKDIWNPDAPADFLNKIKTEGHVYSSIVYPLVSGNEIIGVFLLSLNRPYAELSEFEKESIKSFINVIAVSLDKALVYEQLQVSNQKLAVSNEGQANLIHIMNHQIKGRLGNMKNIFAELATEDYGKIPDAAQPLVEKGLDEANTGISYVQSILRGVSAEKGVLTYDMQPLDFRSIVSEVAAKEKSLADKKGLAFSIEIKDGDYTIQGDQNQLKEVVRNLFDNSINYTLSGSIAIRLERENDTVLLSVKDTGVGLSDEDKTKLFKTGGVGRNSIKINVNSTGYGLAFVKGVVETHKGTVWAESEGQGKGSTFYMKLPVA